MARTPTSMPERHDSLARMENLPVDAVFSSGGYIYQKTLLALDSMPASLFRPSCRRIGSREEKWDEAREMVMDGWPFKVYIPEDEAIAELEKGGELAKYLPEPTITSIEGYHKANPWAEWSMGDWVVGADKCGEIYIREDNNPASGAVLTDEARGIALALLAAANYTEEEQS